VAIDKNTVIKEAQKFAVKGQIDKAIAEWKKLVKEFPNDANAFNTIGDLCLKKDAKTDAVDAYVKAADILASDGFTSKAIALYKKVLNIDSNKIEVHLSLADLNAEKGLTGNALESYKLVADHYTRNKDTIKALSIYQKMADLNPSNVSFRIKLGDMYAKEGMKTDAVDTYLQAADGYLSKDAFNDARQIFEKVLALDPNNRKVYHKAGIVYFKERKFAEACKALKPAFEDDPFNQELVDIYLASLANAGRETETEDVYKKQLSQEAGRIDIRKKLYQHYLMQREYDKALIEVLVIADAMTENKEFDAAEALLKDFVTEVPRSAEGHCRLSELYISTTRRNDAAKELMLAAEILIEEGVRDRAQEVLERAIKIAPDMDEVRQRLDSLQASTAEAAPVVAEPTTQAAPDVPTMLSGGPVALPVADEEPAIAEALMEIEVLVKYGLAMKALEQLEELAGRFSESPQSRIRLRDLYRDKGDVRKAAEHTLVLADIYTKRGLQDEVEPLLQAAFEMDPGNREIAARLGVTPAAASEPPSISAEGIRTSEPALDAMTSEGGHAAEEVAAQEVHPVSDDITLGNLEMDTIEPEVGSLSAAPLPEDLDLEEPQSVEHATEAHEVEKAAPASPLHAEELTLPHEAAMSDTGLKQSEPITEPEKKLPATGSTAVETDISEIWAEAEFYYQQGLFDEAKKYYAKIIEQTPGDKRAIERLSEISREEEEMQEFSKLAEAVEGLEGMAAADDSEGEMALTASDEEAVRSLMSEIQQLRQKQKSALFSDSDRITETGPSETTLRHNSGDRSAHENGQYNGWEPEEQGEQAGEESFFDLGQELRQEAQADSSPMQQEKTEDFFDLASELRDELGSIPISAQPITSAEAEKSLDDIFEEFKKGVDQQAVKEEADTHYNLGVAYKEMGLLDDAVGEFLLTAEGEPKFVQSRYMLGLCYMGKGDYHNAIIEIQNALNYSESTGGNPQERTAMQYDLGLAYQGEGDKEKALAQFQRVHDSNPGYRDTSAKLKELKKGSQISIRQLKDDIEKEISTKFFEEGERIEREEKNKKNERVRN
jgi:pilus assembly protein FimV